YLTKPFQPDVLEAAVVRAVRHHSLVTENEILRSQREEEAEFVVGDGPRMREVVQQVRRVAQTDSTVLIAGESGTGKEVVARAIHAWSPRKGKPFLAVNCAALSAGLLESELFGHERGAFTGADRTRKGRFELADGGTILLDEVSEIDLNLQAKLLRVLQERCFERVGSSASQKVDVRVIATTNRDLQKAIREGKFREDLFFRLNVLPLRLPPLRERREDVEPLARHLVARIARRLGRAIPPVPDRTLTVLRAYDWPGNVRELANVLERGMVLMQGDTLEASDMQAWIEPREARPEAPSAGGALPTMTLEELERRAIEEALARFGGSRLKTAQALGISDRTLRDKLRRWKLAREVTE
ncbi:MAG: sigma-54 dependent transcriptional regulator, partial [Planctomycetota bacterium]